MFMYCLTSYIVCSFIPNSCILFLHNIIYIGSLPFFIPNDSLCIYYFLYNKLFMSEMQNVDHLGENKCV